MIAERLAQYRDTLHGECLEAIARLKAAAPDDPLPEQVEYLTVRATELALQGVGGRIVLRGHLTKPPARTAAAR